MEIDLSNHPISLNCPNCDSSIEVLMKQAMAEEKIICPGCLAEIQLKDEGGSVRRAEVEVNEALAELKRITERFGK